MLFAFTVHYPAILAALWEAATSTRDSSASPFTSTVANQETSYDFFSLASLPVSGPSKTTEDSVTMVAGECELNAGGLAARPKQPSRQLRGQTSWPMSLRHLQAKLDTYPISKPLVVTEIRLRTSSALILPHVSKQDALIVSRMGPAFHSLPNCC